MGLWKGMVRKITGFFREILDEESRCLDLFYRQWA